GFYDRGYPSPRTWIGDREADRVPRMDYPEGGRGREYVRPRAYDVRHRYGKGRNKTWDDRDGRVDYLPNANVW
ncbi:MAG TPA: hypothetical protein VFG50_00545, partial [Rhodothermales bacterium]|nr:hypothetical protein [Rhodothermales bacterium]